MVGLEKRISGDWIDLKSTLNDLYGILQLLGVPLHEMRSAADRLRLCVEQGVVEYKRNSMGPVLAVLETVRYKSPAMDELGEQRRTLSTLLLVVAVQRLLAMDFLPLGRVPEKKEIGVGDMQVNVILSDVNSRIKTKPALRADPSIKNILMQVQLYNKENRKLKDLLPSIKPELRTSFLRNFTQTFSSIIASINRNYAALLLKEQKEKNAGERGFSLGALAMKDLGPLLTSQAKEFSRIHSTLAYACEEKYKTREILVRLYDGRQEAVRLIEDELAEYRRLCRAAPRFSMDECTQGIAEGFRDEVLTVLEKQIKWEAPAPRE
jgi:hypothetical protein